MRKNVNQQKDKIEEFVQRGEVIKKEEKQVPEKGWTNVNKVDKKKVKN